LTGREPLRTADFDYPLPESLVAQVPSAERGQSRLLVVRRATSDSAATFRDAMFDDLPSLFQPGDLVVLNTTKVRHARLLGTRPSGAPAEVLLIHPARDGTWVAIGKPGSAMRPGKRIEIGGSIAVETMEVLPGGERIIRFVGGKAEDAIEKFGVLPLPPYIHRTPDTTDEIRYQTVYAEREGSVAAPTAGLHFTDGMLQRLQAAGVRLAYVDLEVGPGTFQPVEEELVERHRMHQEHYSIPTNTAEEVAAARKRGTRVWAIGTTVVRSLESAVGDDGKLETGRRSTRLMIVPGYRFKVVDALVTNFHLPRSTLLMLVSAFAGYETTMNAYRHAIEQQYRFYSYGDAMVVV